MSPIQRNARVEATDGELGRVTHVIVDPHTSEVSELVVARDRDQWVISVDAVASVEGDRVLLREARARFFMISSPFRRDAFQPADLASLHARVLDPAPWSTAPRDDVPPPHTLGSDAGDVESAASPPSVIPLSIAGDSDTVAAPAPHEERDAVLPASLRMRREVTEWVETLTVTLRAERLVIEVLTGGGPVTVDGRVLQPGEIYELPVTTERARIIKEIVTGNPEGAPPAHRTLRMHD